MQKKTLLPDTSQISTVYMQVDKLLSSGVVQIVLYTIGLTLAYSAFDKRLSLIEQKLDQMTVVYGTINSHEIRLTKIESKLEAIR